MRRTLHRTSFALLASAIGCQAAGDGQLAITINGEEGARDGFGPAAAGDELGFVDGWSLEFERYVVALGDIEVADGTGEVAATADRIFVADLTEGVLELDVLAELPAKRWDAFGFSVRAPEAGDDVVAIGAVDEADIERMRAEGANYLVAGTARKDGRTITFEWALSNATRNLDCTNGVDGTAGVVVTTNRTVNAEITLHVEHMFWDRLGSEQVVLRFDAIAAMADDAGVVPWDALADQNLANLVDQNGEPLTDEAGAPLLYDPTSSGATDLQAFILASTRTQAHLGGEGLCRIEAL